MRLFSRIDNVREISWAWIFRRKGAYADQRFRNSLNIEDPETSVKIRRFKRQPKARFAGSVVFIYFDLSIHSSVWQCLSFIFIFFFSPLLSPLRVAERFKSPFVPSSRMVVYLFTTGLFDIFRFFFSESPRMNRIKAL